MTTTIQAHAIQTFSGKLLDFSNPSADSICLTDIVVGLSRAPRWSGQLRANWSVLQHSLLVHRVLGTMGEQDSGIRCWGLLHDAAEAYMCDIPSPLKRLIPKFTEIERGLLKAVRDNLDLPYLYVPGPSGEVDHPDMLPVSYADKIAMVAEAHFLGGRPLSSFQFCEEIISAGTGALVLDAIMSVADLDARELARVWVLELANLAPWLDDEMYEVLEAIENLTLQ